MLARVKSVEKQKDGEEYQLEIHIESPELSALAEQIDTAMILHLNEESAGVMYEQLFEVKRKNWSVLLNAPLIWGNGQGGVHLHACTAKIVQKSLDSVWRAVKKEAEL